LELIISYQDHPGHILRVICVSNGILTQATVCHISDLSRNCYQLNKSPARLKDLFLKLNTKWHVIDNALDLSPLSLFQLGILPPKMKVDGLSFRINYFQLSIREWIINLAMNLACQIEAHPGGVI